MSEQGAAPEHVPTEPQESSSWLRRLLRRHGAVVIPVAIVVAVLVFVGAGFGIAGAVAHATRVSASESDPDDSSDDDGPSPSDSADPSPAPSSAPAAPVANLAHSAQWSFRNPAGFSYDLTVSLGDPVRFDPSNPLTHPGDRSTVAGSACAINPTYDIVIPAEWKATATTASFATKISMDGIFVNGSTLPFDQLTDTVTYAGSGVAPTGTDNRVEVEQRFGDGPKCTEFSSTNIWGYAHSNGFGVSFPTALAQNASARQDFFIIVKNYFGPSTPDGDPALLDWIVFRPLSGITGGDDASSKYADVNGTNLVYSEQGMTLAGRVVGKAAS